jgi:hypothetical protein
MSELYRKEIEDIVKVLEKQFQQSNVAQLMKEIAGMINFSPRDFLTE